MSNLKFDVLLSAKDNISEKIRQVGSAFKSTEGVLDAHKKNLGDIQQAQKSLSAFAKATAIHEQATQRFEGAREKKVALENRIKELQWLKKHKQINEKQLKSLQEKLKKAEFHTGKFSRALKDKSKSLDKASDAMRRHQLDVQNLAGEEQRLAEMEHKLTRSIEQQSKATERLLRKKAAMTKVAKASAMTAAAGYGAKRLIQGASGSYLDAEKAKGKLQSLDPSGDFVKQADMLGKQMQSAYAGIQRSEIFDVFYKLKSGISSLDAENMKAIAENVTVTAQATLAQPEQMASLYATLHGLYRQSRDYQSDSDFFNQMSGMLASCIDIFKTSGPEMQKAIENLGGGIHLDVSEQWAALGLMQQKLNYAQAGTTLKEFAGHAVQAHEYFQNKFEGKDRVEFIDERGFMLPLQSIFDNLYSRYGDTLSDRDIAELKTALGSETSKKLILQLYDLRDELKINTKKLEHRRKDGLTVAKIMKQRMDDNHQARFEHFWQKVDLLKQAFAQSLMPALVGLVDKLTPLVELLGDFIARCNEAKPKFTSLLSALSTLAISIGTTVMAFKAMKMVLKGVGLAKTSSALAKSHQGGGKLKKVLSLGGSAFKKLAPLALRLHPMAWAVMAPVAIAAAVSLYHKIKGLKSDKLQAAEKISGEARIAHKSYQAKKTEATKHLVQQRNQQSTTINANIQIHPSTGMDERKLADKVRACIEDLKFEAEVNQRSQFVFDFQQNLN